MQELQKLKKEIIKTGLLLKEYNLISLAGGNVSVRLKNGNVLVTPSGMNYEEMTVDDIVTVDPQGNVVEGSRKPSVDTEALLYVYNHVDSVHAIIHTHQAYATAVGLIDDVLPSVVTTLPNVALGDVNVAAYGGAATVDMGIQAVEYLGGKRAVILKHHGVLTVGETLKQALYAAIYLEDAAKTYLAAKSVGEPVRLSDQQVEEAVVAFRGCGQ